MKEKVKERIDAMIKDEDPRQPYTDVELSHLLKTKRNYITSLRKELDIPDSNERRKGILLQTIQKVLSDNMTSSERDLTRLINEQGFSVSRTLIRECKRELLQGTFVLSSKKRAETLPPEVKKSAFDGLIGAEGSLKPFIQQAKAAMLYPPNGLHTLILGPTGVGKSDLAAGMYAFAKEEKVIKENAPYIVFNCADYADNPQLLMAQLFGYVKGAFTGADGNKEGLVEKADGGLIFLDEVHRLPPEGQELLFYLIDRNKFRRLGETDAERTVQVTIIAATTENPDSILLGTFRRRIPMMIELPSLEARPLSERLDIIKYFFKKEAYRTKTTVQAENEVIKALLLYDCPGNLGQLKSDIQVSCARSFLNKIVSQKATMKVITDDLPQSAKKGLLKLHTNRSDIDQLLGSYDIIVSCETEPDVTAKESLYGDIYSLPKDIYDYIEHRYEELHDQNINQEAMNSIIEKEMEEKLKKLVRKVEDNARPIEKKDLVKIVGAEVISVMDKMIEIANKKLPITADNLYYVLAIHLSTTVERIRKKKSIKNPQLDKIKSQYKNEFEVAKEMLEIIKAHYGFDIPEDEAGFITMYLTMMTKEKETVDEGRVGILILSHGNVASAVADVANRLLGVTHAKAVEMSLDERPEYALERATVMVKNIDEGKGVLFLVDMGSLLTFGDIISKNTGIRIKSVSRVDTLLVIEAVRRSILPEANLDDIAHYLDERNKRPNLDLYVENMQNYKPKSKVIVTICMTGEGTAITLKKALEKKLPGDVTVICLGAVDVDIHKKLYGIMETSKIISIVGSYNPYFLDIPFFTVRDILEGAGIAEINTILKNTRYFEPDKLSDYCSLPKLKAVMKAENFILNMDAKDKDAVLEKLCDHLYKKGLVKAEYKKSVFDREELAATFFNRNTVVPHGDPQYVNITSIVIAKLSKKIAWGQGKTNFVVLFAAGVDDMKLAQELYNFLTWEHFEKNMDNIRSYDELYRLVESYKE